MHRIQARNVNRAFQSGMLDLGTNGVREDSRNGPVRVYPEPVATTYERPCERVLFHRARRANPFFHLFEAFWMLQGRDDAAFLDRYVSDFGARFADNGTLHGAYGFRWRNWLDVENRHGFDQIEWAVDHLLQNPMSRRAVIQMYDPSLDSTSVGIDPPLDIPCNTTIYLRMFPETVDREASLDLTVCCRSNDAVWGAWGANAVHFSILLEYLAFRLDCRVGRMHQLSNNLHIYDATAHLFDPTEVFVDPYAEGLVSAESLFSGADPAAFDRELSLWIEDPSNVRRIRFHSPVFRDLLIPMSVGHDLIKEKKWETASSWLANVRHTDWRAGALQWIETRKKS